MGFWETSTSVSKALREVNSRNRIANVSFGEKPPRDRHPVPGSLCRGQVSGNLLCDQGSIAEQTWPHEVNFPAVSFPLRFDDQTEELGWLRWLSQAHQTGGDDLVAFQQLAKKNSTKPTLLKSLGGGIYRAKCRDQIYLAIFPEDFIFRTAWSTTSRMRSFLRSTYMNCATSRLSTVVVGSCSDEMIRSIWVVS